MVSFLSIASHLEFHIMYETLVDDDRELASAGKICTLVLAGHTGNGKSATGNSILGRKAFVSRRSPESVTHTCELQQSVVKNGQIINVIDTPGLFDVSPESENVEKEILKCINLAKDGVQAVLVVLSIGQRFSEEQKSTIENLRKLFGEKLEQYMILVFTGGDDLEENQTLEEYMEGDTPEFLKETLLLCGNRSVVFGNRTKDSKKRAQQVKQLLLLVDMVTTNNGGKPFTQEGTENVNTFEGCSEQKISELCEKILKSYDEQLKHTNEMLSAIKKVEFWTRKLVEILEKAQMEEIDEIQKQEMSKCIIL